MTDTKANQATGFNFKAHDAVTGATEFNFSKHQDQQEGQTGPASEFNFGAHNTVVHVIKHYKDSIDGQTIECHFCSRVVTDYMDVKNKFCGFCRKSLVFEHRVPAGVKELNFSGNSKPSEVGEAGITELNFGGNASPIKPTGYTEGGGVTELNFGGKPATESIPASGGTLVK